MMANDRPTRDRVIDNFVVLMPSAVFGGRGPRTTPLVERDHPGIRIIVGKLVGGLIGPAFIYPDEGTKKGPAVVVDPRAIIFTWPHGPSEDADCIYTPRDIPTGQHQKEFRTWLNTHHNWGVRPVPTNLIFLAETLRDRGGK